MGVVIRTAVAVIGPLGPSAGTTMRVREAHTRGPRISFISRSESGSSTRSKSGWGAGRQHTCHFTYYDKEFILYSLVLGVGGRVA